MKILWVIVLNYPVIQILKVFLFLYREHGFLGLTVKLPESGQMALTLPFASPTGYGMGKYGWVSAKFGPADAVPIDMIKEWIDESFHAIAPKPKRKKK